jgi:amino acid transporter
MAEVAVDERRLLKTIRWWDGFVIGLANPGFLLIGLWGSIIALGGQWAIALWIISALMGALQAYIYCEPAAMFPDKPGGLSVYAREGWRKHFSFAGPIAVFGYWFAWSSVLAIYGSLIGYLLIAEFGAGSYFDPAETTYDVGLPYALGWPQLIGVACIVLCWIFNIRGMRPAVGLSYVVGALMIFPILVIAIGGFVTGDFSNHEINSNVLAANVEFYGDEATFFNQFVMVMVWLYILGWSTYGPEAGATFAPEYKDTVNDTRKALASVGALNVVLSIMLPIVVLGTIGYDALYGDITGVVWLTDVVNSIAGEGFGKFLVVCLCAGLLLSMNTATMDGSRALYALSEEKMTIKQLGTLNKHNVPGRAMTVDMLLNIFLLLIFQNIYFILAAGNLGYMLSHVIALSGVLLLRRDRPNWPRPIKLGKVWMWLAGLFCAANALFIIFGLYGLKYTGYGFDYLGQEYQDFLAGVEGASPSPTARIMWIIIVGVLVLVAGVLGYIIAQKQWGKPIRMRDPSDEQPSQEAIDAAAARAPASAPAAAG